MRRQVSTSSGVGAEDSLGLALIFADMFSGGRLKFRSTVSTTSTGTVMKGSPLIDMTTVHVPVVLCMSKITQLFHEYQLVQCSVLEPKGRSPESKSGAPEGGKN